MKTQTMARGHLRLDRSHLRCIKASASHSRRLRPVACVATAPTTTSAPKADVRSDRGKPATYSGGYAVCAKGEALKPWGHELPALLPNEIDIKVTHNGICHSDVHMRDDDWFISKFPFIPGHEVVGEVIAIGSSVTNLKPGERVGVAWIKNSCRRCAPCLRGEENICEPGYEGLIVAGNHGGFQAAVRINADFAFTIPEAVDSASAAPLLCAGVTVFAPLKKWLTRPGMEVAILGVGGLGHLAVQFAAAMGGVVTALDRNADKEEQTKKFGADKYVLATADNIEKLKGSFDVILNCASGAVATGPLLGMLKNDGVLVQAGIPGDNAQMTLPLTDLVFGQKKVVGSIVGGRSDMANMFAVAAAKGVRPLLEIMPSTQLNEALERVQSGKARYRVVVDMQAVEDPALVLKT